MSIDPKTGIKPISEWGHECARGFVRNARFGTGLVIPGTNREKQRKLRRESAALSAAAPDSPESGTAQNARERSFLHE